MKPLKPYREQAELYWENHNSDLKLEAVNKSTSLDILATIKEVWGQADVAPKYDILPVNLKNFWHSEFKLTILGTPTQINEAVGNYKDIIIGSTQTMFKITIKTLIDFAFKNEGSGFSNALIEYFEDISVIVDNEKIFKGKNNGK